MKRGEKVQADKHQILEIRLQSEECQTCLRDVFMTNDGVVRDQPTKTSISNKLQPRFNLWCF